MDSLTQIVLGASVGEAVLGKKEGNKAMVYGAIAGTIPDLDILARYVVDTVTATEWHRGFSHSIFFAVIAAPIFGWLISKLERKSIATFKDWSWLMFWGLLTHPVLDAFTTWGTQLFWPLKTRLAFQNIFVIDPLYTLPFLFFLILAMFQKRTSPKRKRYNRLGLTVSSAYLITTIILKWFAYQEFAYALKVKGISYEALSTRPTPFNSLLWTANVDVGDRYLIGNYSFFDSKDISFRAYSKNHELLGALGDNEKVKRLIDITEGWYTVNNSGKNLLLNDLRFGLISLDPEETKFAFSYELVDANEQLAIKETPKFNRDAKRAMSALWKRMWGN